MTMNLSSIDTAALSAFVPEVVTAPIVDTTDKVVVEAPKKTRVAKSGGLDTMTGFARSLATDGVSIKDVVAQMVPKFPDRSEKYLTGYVKQFFGYLNSTSKLVFTYTD